MRMMKLSRSAFSSATIALGPTPEATISFR